MVAKVILLLALCSLTRAVVFKFNISQSSNLATCTLVPCYSLQHFCDNQELLSGNGSVKLLFMSGVHQVNNCTISASNLEKLELLPRNVQEKVEIKQAKFVLTSIKDLIIISLKFTTCSFQYHAHNNMRRDINDSYFQMNAFYVSNCTFTLSRECAIIINNGTERVRVNISLHNCIFSSNEAGGLCKTEHSSEPSIISIYDSLFKNNSAICASAINVYMNIQRSQFISCKSYTGAVSAHYSSVLIEDSIFHSNVATGSRNWRDSISGCSLENSKGGAIYSNSRESTIDIIIKGSMFRNNSAMDSGGAIYFESDALALKVSNCVFQDNFANIFGGAVYTSTSLGGQLFMTNISYINRAGKYGGAAAHSSFYRPDLSQVYYTGLKAVSNEAKRGGAFYLSRVTFNVRGNHNSSAESDTLFANNKASLEGGAIYASDSVIDVSEHAVVIVENNTAGNEGGGWFIDDTDVEIHANILIAFRHNVVTSTSGRGGAIFYNDEAICHYYNDLFIRPQCFLMGNSSIGKVLEFTDNTASSGSVLYGGLLDICRTDSGLTGIHFFKHISQHKLNPAISSDPARLCWCFNDTEINCTTRELNFTKMRGGKVHLSLAVLDQDANPISFHLLARYKEKEVELEAGEKIRKTDENCTNLSYHVFTVKSSATLIVELTGPHYCPISVALTDIRVHINLTECLRGFELDFDRCVCERRLQQYFGEDIACDVDSESVLRKGPVWLRYNQEQELEISNNCPLDYCSLTSHTISLSSPDQQCANYRSGILCGNCSHNHSVALGGSKCLPCQSHYTFLWLTLVFAVAGMLLVALLLLCNMTVSSGSLNGLIFYANIVSTSGVAGLHDCTLHPTLSLFVAWLNLDLGVHTCFYPDMDTYHKTWLQFAFPLYIWLLVGAIIAASHYSSRAMRVFGRNNVAILATLFLLSYSKLGGGGGGEIQFQPHNVWTYDGNVSFLEKKHTILFAVSLLFLVLLFLPYTLLLTFGQCLRSAPLRRHWVRRLVQSTAFVSILDAYHAPYQRRHCYWTGLMLLTRCGLFLAFATFQSDTSVPANMFVTNLTVIAILLYKTLASKVYKHLFVNLLELCFLINLGILSAILFYVKDSSPTGGDVM